MGLGYYLKENGSIGIIFKQKTEQSGESRGGRRRVQPCMRQVGEGRQEGAEALTHILAFMLSTAQGQCLARVALRKVWLSVADLLWCAGAGCLQWSVHSYLGRHKFPTSLRGSVASRSVAF